VDEAASRLRMAIDSKPQALDEVDRDIMQLEIEREALKKEKDKASKERLAKAGRRAGESQRASNALATRWQAEKEAIVQVQTIKEEMDQARVQVEQAQREMDYQKAAELQYGRLHTLEQSLKNATTRLNELQQGGALLKEEVDAEDIAQIVAKWTGIPATRLLEGEMEKLVYMEERLHTRVVGQTRRSARWRRPCGAAGPGCKTPTGRSAASSSWGRRAWARQNWRGRWPNSCSTTRATWCALT
jgi:ATP-dependent Clp protease ATP-binding subunit ClpB